jgi:hypothetical protein
VQHAPGVLFEVPQGESDIAGEVALVDNGNAASEAIKSKVLDFLKSWRRQEGQSRIDELKDKVREQMQQRRAQGKLTEEQLNTRIDEFFQLIQG